MLSQVLSSLILTTAPWKRYHWPDSFSYSEEKNEMLERCCVRTQILSQEAWGSVWCSRKAKTSFSQRKAKWIHFSSSPHGWHYGPRVVIIHLHSFRSALRWPPAILPHPACITSWTFHIIYQIMSPPTWNPQWLPSCCMKNESVSPLCALQSPPWFISWAPPQLQDGSSLTGPLREHTKLILSKSPWICFSVCLEHWSPGPFPMSLPGPSLIACPITVDHPITCFYFLVPYCLKQSKFVYFLFFSFHTLALWELLPWPYWSLISFIPNLISSI